MRGGQRQVVLLLRALRQARHQSVLLARKYSPLWHAAEQAGFAAYPAQSTELWKRSSDCDLVHAHDAHAHTIAVTASRRPFVVSRRVSFLVKTGLLSALKYRKAARYLAVSQIVMEQLKAANISQDKIDLVYDAVGDVEPAEPWSPEFPAVALASRDPDKGRDLIERAAAHSGIEVIYSDDLPRDLKRASMFVYITRNEGLGSAALLAMKMGVPVVASAVGGLHEVFIDGESGLYVNNDVTDIIKAMRRIFANTGLAHKLITAGKARIEERFTVEHMLQATLASYRRVIAP
jgi:glycosyltransferase involved in cell wall biosynthesis